MDGPRGQREGARRASRKARSRTRRRLGGGLVATVLLVGVLFVAVFPTRSYLAQRAATRTSEQQLRTIRTQRAAVERQRSQLRTDEVIEQLARKWFGYVKPGEEAYNVLPAPTKPLGLPDTWPFTDVDAAVAAG